MKRITLRIRHAPALRIDARTLLPATLAQRSAGEIERLPLWHGTQRIALAELFEVRVDDAPDDPPSLILAGDMRRFDRIGWKMDGGHLAVQGNAGDLAATLMTAGTFVVDGDAGSFAACQLCGGRVEVRGNVGDFAAGALPGDLDGMRGGTLIVRGDAGARFGDRMRRGTALVYGNAGAFAASRMVAGTIGIAGGVGAHLAYGMRRGSLLLVGAEPVFNDRFAENHGDIDVFGRLLCRSLVAEGGPFGELAQASMRRLVGDVSVDGKGEVLLFG
jgi:formylmethanofuran dehydrogenase subunit C